MNPERPYSGAYSRRRFSNADVSNLSANYTEDPSDVKKRNLTVRFNGLIGRVAGEGLTVGSEVPPCVASATVTDGVSVTIVAQPFAGYHFVKWVGAPVNGYTSPTQTIKMTANYDITAIFEADDPGTTPPNGNTDGGPVGGDHDHDAEKPDGYQYKPQGGSTGVLAFLGVYPMQGESNLRAFVRKYWWAILIVGYIAYKEWKGARQ